ncbi:C13 family peptidase [Uliginosibacterium sp. H1]|uniref:C13 family peptidase n=1 Tax=Uliginosibacterium sp. H1 TaxID=3114757 RepID=UPI002E17BDF7|nr:C13 family peptidase [Uliginosibacterium sp. H1]
MNHDTPDAAFHAADTGTGAAEALAPASPRFAPAPQHALTHVLATGFGNVWAGLRLALFQRGAIAALQVSVPQLVWLVVLGLLLSLGSDLVRVGLDGQFNPSAVPYEFYGLPWVLLCAWLVANVAGDASRTLAAAIAVLALQLVAGVVWEGLGFLPPQWWQALGEQGAQLLWWSPLVWLCVATMVALARICDLQVPRRLVLLAVPVLLVLPAFLVGQPPQLWVARYEEDPEVLARREAVVDESVLYRQNLLLDQVLSKVAPGTPGVPEYFFVGLAGHGGQDVFMREVESVDRLFAERFGTGQRSVLLVNNPATTDIHPFATVTALQRALKTIGERMNRDEDVLFLFMTSHGAADFRFDLSLWPYRLHELSPEVLRKALDDAGIRYRVLIVSACYSGGFVPPLSSPDSLVISAARADRNSHGCAHENDWTFFGRALFDNALQKTFSVEQAFDIAREDVAKQEAAEGLEPSEPQISVGDAVRKPLAAVEQGLSTGAAGK